VRAQDCIASIKRWAVREPIGQLMAGTVAEYVPVDDRTFEIRLKKPFPLMLDALAKPDSSNPFIMPERIAATDPMKAFTEVIGSGPYRFLPDEFVSGSRVGYAKFEGYVPRQEAPEWATGAKIAYFDRVEWQIIPDSATASAALQRGEVDWWERPLNDLLPTLMKSPGVKTFIQDPSGRMALMRLNHLQPPFNDPRIRRAVLMSVDQEEYMRAANGDDPALWKVCPSIYPCGTPFESFSAAKRLMRGDLDAARRMLKEAGYNGQKVVIINPTDYPQIGPAASDRHERRLAGERLGHGDPAAHLARAGREGRVEHLPYDRFVAGLFEPGGVDARAGPGREGLVRLVEQP
jgi:peptide/nickel transport system substrate-binding protein